MTRPAVGATTRSAQSHSFDRRQRSPVEVMDQSRRHRDRRAASEVDYLGKIAGPPFQPGQDTAPASDATGMVVTGDVVEALATPPGPRTMEAAQ